MSKQKEGQEPTSDEKQEVNPTDESTENNKQAPEQPTGKTPSEKPGAEPEKESGEKAPEPTPPKDTVPRDVYKSVQEALRRERQKRRELQANDSPKPETKLTQDQIASTQEGDEPVQVLREVVRSETEDIRRQLSKEQAERDAERREQALEKFFYTNKEAVKYAEEMTQIIKENPERFDEFSLDTVYLAAKGLRAEKDLEEARKSAVEKTYKTIESKQNQPAKPAKTPPVDTAAEEFVEKWRGGEESDQVEYLLKHVIKK